ncbi:SPIDR protein, partial [Nothocercus julius]|nr:SPIDR protein [Nothocercus julius]
WNAGCTSFPDETPLQLKKSNARTSVAGTSISSSWLRCGDGFQSTSMLESLKPTDKQFRFKKHLGPLLTSAESTVGSSPAVSSKESEDIIWSSSGSDFSDDENKTSVSRLCSEKSPASEAEKSCSRTDLLSENRSGEDEPQFIEWEKDSDSTGRCDGSDDDDGSLEISDSDSCTNQNSLPDKEETYDLSK